jgi:hypothetical protein
MKHIFLISFVASIGLACEPGASVDGARSQADASSPSDEADARSLSADDASRPSDSGAVSSDATLRSDGMLAAGVGTYEVPVPAALAAAATFIMTEVNWRVGTDGVARLAYDLPVGLVGGALRVAFEGPYDAIAQRATLTGAPGTAVCAIAGANLVCNETMRGLLPIVSDPALIAAAASAEYAGPPQDRVDVAALFGGDPIGILRVNLAAIEAKDSSRRDR